MWFCQLKKLIAEKLSNLSDSELNKSVYVYNLSADQKWNLLSEPNPNCDCTVIMINTTTITQLNTLCNFYMILTDLNGILKMFFFHKNIRVMLCYNFVIYHSSLWFKSYWINPLCFSLLTKIWRKIHTCAYLHVHPRQFGIFPNPISSTKSHCS